MSTSRTLTPEARRRLLVPTLTAVVALWGGVMSLALWHPLDAWGLGVRVTLIGAPLVALGIARASRRLVISELPPGVRWATRIYFGAGLMSLWLALVFGINALGDRSTPIEGVVKISGRSMRRARGQTRYLVHFPVADQSASLAVNADQFERALVSGRVRFSVGAGLLGLPWLTASQYVEEMP